MSREYRVVARYGHDNDGRLVEEELYRGSSLMEAEREYTLATVGDQVESETVALQGDEDSLIGGIWVDLWEYRWAACVECHRDRREIEVGAVCCEVAA